MNSRAYVNVLLLLLCLRQDSYMLLSSVGVLAGWRLGDDVHVHGNEETCRPLQCSTFVCFDNIGAVWHRGKRFIRHTGSTYLWDCLVFSWDLIYIKKNEERFHRTTRLWVPGTRSPECQLKYYERQCFVHTRIHSNQQEILLWHFRAAVISRGNWVITIVN